MFIILKDKYVNNIESFKTIGITGASGALGKELTKLFRKKGHRVIGFTHNKNDQKINNESPNEWIFWECGREFTLIKHLKKLDILINGARKRDNTSFFAEMSKKKYLYQCLQKD